METIAAPKKIWSFVNASSKAGPVNNGDIRRDKGHAVNSYRELATKIAELQFFNRDHLLLFRGEGKDRQNQRKRTSLKPRLFRPDCGKRGNPGPAVLKARLNRLRCGERLLVAGFEERKCPGWQRVRRQRILQWSILQHYQVCDTPLLDVTHSLRIAASFASLDAEPYADHEAFVFVLGIPNLSGAITTSVELGIQIVRLASVCPPQALRPHIQEGYLIGEYPEMGDYEQQSQYKPHEIDFGRRLVAKFRFDPHSFWNDEAFSEGTPASSIP